MMVDTRSFTNSDKKVIDWVGANVLVNELLDVIRESLKWGPIPTLKGDLFEIHQAEIPHSVWCCFLELEDWGGGNLGHIPNTGDAFLLADAIHIDLILCAFRKLLDDNVVGMRKSFRFRQLSQVAEQSSPRKRPQKVEGADNGFEPR